VYVHVGRGGLPAHHVGGWSQQFRLRDVRGFPGLHDTRGDRHGRHGRAGHGVVPHPRRRQGQLTHFTRRTLSHTS